MYTGDCKPGHAFKLQEAQGDTRLGYPQGARAFGQAQGLKRSLGIFHHWSPVAGANELLQPLQSEFASPSF